MKKYGHIHSSQLAYRFTIGMTGHRSLQDPDSLRLAVGTIIDEILDNVKSSAGLPVKLSVLYALAEGADRLVAEVILVKAKDAVTRPFCP